MARRRDTAVEVAARYIRRGWSLIPIPNQSKTPSVKGWQQLRLSEKDLPGHFNGHPLNIGVLLGEPSGWLIDVDLDHHVAVRRAPDFLPDTPLRFGRAGKPESHWIYRVTGPVATKKHRSKSAGMLVELRSTGSQTVFPPSVHESGEAIQFVEPDAEPAEVDSDVLLEAVKSLADAVLVELGEKAPRRSHSPKRHPPSPPIAAETVPAAERSARALEAMLRLRVADHRDGSLRLYSAACRCVEHDLPDDDALALLREYCRLRPFSRARSDEELLKRLSDARKRAIPGAAYRPQRESDGLVALGGRDPDSGRVVLSPKRTLPTATAYVLENHQSLDGRTLHSYAGELWEWNGSRYVALDEGGALSRLLPWLHEALRYSRDRETGEMVLVPFDANPASTKAALESLHAHTHLPSSVSCPSWLDGRTGPPPEELLVCRSAMLHLPTGELLEPTPQFFTTTALDFDYDPGAPDPMQWHAFLHQLFDGDLQSLDLLQEWFGYSLVADTSQQKMLLVVGPRRSGKGTIARVLRQLAGEENVCGPTTSSLASNFGLQPLIGKSLAVVSDARFSGENMSTVAERLLAVSGEDAVSIDRKYLQAVTMKLPTRFMFLTNEFPRLNDASGALAGRFVILRLTTSFYGREDTGLTERLFDELPGILNWAIEGWKRLRERGHFVMPESCAEAMLELEELSSPVQAFVREMCLVAPDARVRVNELYAEWKRWCESEGRSKATTKQTFGRDLKAAFSHLTCRKGTYGRFYEGIGLRSDEPC